MTLRGSVLSCLTLMSSMALAMESVPIDINKMQQKFPDNFLMGSAISGFQTEMGCPTFASGKCDDSNSDWYQFVNDPQFSGNFFLFLSGDAVQQGPGFFELYKDDIQRARQESGQNSLRISLEWSRIFPNATFDVEGFQELRALASPDALNYYHQVLGEMKRQGLKPLVTLNHYTLPTWIHDAVSCNKGLSQCTKKGWVEPETIVPEIAKYARFVAQEFGSEVDLWATLNEPFAAVVLPGYVFPSPMRSNPPGLHMQLTAAKIAAKAMIEAHARMYDAVHEADIWDADNDGVKASVGLVSLFNTVHPRSANPKDLDTVENFVYLVNDLFFHATIEGRLDENWDGNIVDRPDLKGRMDYIGINYYTRIDVQEAWFPVLSFVSPYLTLDPLQVSQGGGYPPGIYEVIADVSKFKLPMIITETGAYGAKSDQEIESWLVQTLAWTRQAIADGYDVRGYFFWTLFDNFEWNIGYNMNLGLYQVKHDDPLKTRVARSAVGVYREISEAGAVPADILSRYIDPKAGSRPSQSFNSQSGSWYSARPLH